MDASVASNTPDDPVSAVSALRARYRAAARLPKKHLGQNFLADLNLAGKMVDLLGETGDAPVFEIGPGLGALTALLTARGRRVLAVEKDAALAKALAGALAPWPRTEVRQGDVIEESIPTFLATEAARPSTPTAAESPSPTWQVIGNLPYYATSPILFRLIESRAWIDSMVLTMQAEVAERLGAAPGSRTYGGLSVTVQSQATTTARLRLPRTAFWPAPEVDSTTLRLDWRQPALVPAAGWPQFQRVVRAAFAERRKQLVNSLESALDCDRAQLLAACEVTGVRPDARAETLAPEAFAALAQALQDVA